MFFIYVYIYKHIVYLQEASTSQSDRFAHTRVFELRRTNQLLEEQKFRFWVHLQKSFTRRHISVVTYLYVYTHNVFRLATMELLDCASLRIKHTSLYLFSPVLHSLEKYAYVHTNIYLWINWVVFALWFSIYIIFAAWITTYSRTVDLDFA